VRQALFDILGPRIEEASVLDLFAGAGTFSFEALSRGAAHATLVERDRGVAKLIAATCVTLGCQDLVEVAVGDVRHWLAAQATLAAEIVWLDPPYADESVNGVMEEVCQKTRGLVVCEHHQRRQLAANFGPKSLARRVDYGQTTLSFYEGGQ
jgi:16S rRNA (guanine966-N2)-methyltransferase